MELAYTKRTRAGTAFGIVSSRGVRRGRRFNHGGDFNAQASGAVRSGSHYTGMYLLFIVLFFSSFKPLKLAIRYIYKADTNQIKIF